MTTSETVSNAATPAAQPFNPEKAFQGASLSIADLRDAYEVARRKLKRAKKTEDFLFPLIESERALIAKMLGLWFTPDSIADIIQTRLEQQNLTVGRRKLLNAIKRCTPIVEGHPPRKRIGRPPKNAAATTFSVTEQANPSDISTEKTAAVVAETVIASAKSASVVNGNSEKSAEKSASSTQKEDSDDRKQRLRRKAPSWTANYNDHPQYGSVVARGDNESDADYNWRMWHTAPPWADELPRSPAMESETQWIQRCWLLTSPEERAAHEASLPTTAR